MMIIDASLPWYVACESYAWPCIATISQYLFEHLVGKSCYINENVSCLRKQKHRKATLLKIANCFHHISAMYAAFNSVSNSMKHYYLSDIFMSNITFFIFQPGKPEKRHTFTPKHSAGPGLILK